MKASKSLSVLLSLMLILFFLSASITVAILFRPFYYWQISSLRLMEQTGWSEQTIRNAYDDVMDYLVYDAPFRTGELRWSQSGKEHFADCKKLFQLNFFLLGTSALSLSALFILYKHKKIGFHHFLGRCPAFWSTIFMIVIFSLIALWAILDFNHLFTTFHTIFFPGKTNWIFDARFDQIIRILPESFWIRVSAFVLSLSIGGIPLSAAIAEYLHHKTRK